MQHHQVAIYGLYDPRDGALRYVGKADDPRNRLRTHLEQATTRTHKGCWLVQLKALGLTPELEVLDWVPRSVWPERERAWITSMRLTGCDLTNGTDGGEGGFIAQAQTVEAQAKRSASNRGRVRTDETKALLSKLARERDPKCYVGVPPVQRGVANGRARMTEELVVDLRRWRRAGGQLRPWAEANGVTVQAASYAAVGRTWAHVSEPPVPEVRKQKLSADDVGVIRELFGQGMSQADIARRVGISPGHVSCLVRHRKRPDGAALERK